MAEVQWIKLYISMFNNEKIKYIRKLPEGSGILLTWVMLLTSAGRCNANGYIFLTENIPYSPEMLSNEFEIPLNTVRLALATFQNLNMINVDEQGIIISNWCEYQNIDGLEKIKEQNRLRAARHRENQKLLKESNVTDNVTVTQSNGTDIEEDIELDKDKKINNIPYLDIITYLNNKAGTSYKPTTKKTKDLINARFNEKFTLEDFKTVIDNKVADWKGKFDKDGNPLGNYLRPETLFGTKFEGYLNQKKDKPQSQSTNSFDFEGL